LAAACSISTTRDFPAAGFLTVDRTVFATAFLVVLLAVFLTALFFVLRVFATLFFTVRFFATRFLEARFFATFLRTMIEFPLDNISVQTFVVCPIVGHNAKH
jgi:hypothetical protein